MTFPFDFQRTYLDRLPNPAEEPLLAEHDSYYRLLLRSTASHPAARFSSAEEMKDQLTGVLREVLAAEDGAPRPGASTEFTPERRSFGTDSSPTGPDPATLVTALPVPRVDGSDPAAAFLATVTATDPGELIEELNHAPQATPEVRLRIIRAHIENNDVATARRRLDELARDTTVDLERGWLIDWYRGVAALAERDLKAASEFFDRVYSAVPGEAAPKLALAVAAEAAQDWPTADRYYRIVWRTDRSYVSAAFGLARTLLARGERLEAFDVLCSVPDTSIHHIAARLAAAQARLRARRTTQPHELTEADLVAAGEVLTDLELDQQRKAVAERHLFDTALAWVSNGHGNGARGTVLGCPLTDDDLRVALERCYRTLARHANDTRERIALVDSANQIRPTTWV
jgi:serine/threonine-protein kinase PknG